MSSFNSYNVDVTGQPERPRREKRLVRFVHPSGLTAHELILARQKELDAASIACGVRPLRSTAEEIGFNAPKLLSVQRDRTQGALRDSIYLDRRRRVLDLSQSRMKLDISPAQCVENILSTPRPSGVRFSVCTHIEVLKLNACIFSVMKCIRLCKQSAASCLLQKMEQGPIFGEGDRPLRYPQVSQ